MTLTNEQIDKTIKTFTHMLGMDLEGKYLTKWELEQAITALEMAKANVWQPIETAPKDEYIKAKNDFFECECFYDTADDVWFFSRDDNRGYLALPVPPTHWMPIPTPPKESE